MKLSKMRKKARSAFKHPKQIRYRDLEGHLRQVPLEGEQEVAVPVVVIRSRQFTKPQAARQKEG